MNSRLYGTLTNISNHSRNKISATGIADSVPIVDGVRRKELAAFQKAAGIRFRSYELLNLSFVHRSASNERARKDNNERLEFLGDAILGAVTATQLYSMFPDSSEGDLAKIKSVVVSEDSLSGIALELQIDRLLILGKGEELSGGRTKKAILADTLEALLGAYYLDSGFKGAYEFISPFIQREILRVQNEGYGRDFKTLLQELSQKLYHAYPNYMLIKRTGPDHERLFWMEVTVNGTSFGPGTGRNKKDAEQAAAKKAYESILATLPDTDH